MLPTTLKLIRAALEADPAVAPKDRNKIMTTLRGGVECDNTKKEPAPPRILRRLEAARRLGGSVRLVDRLAQTGELTKFRLPGRVRAAGFLESDINALIGVIK
jgi:hypothetical protein